MPTSWTRRQRLDIAYEILKASERGALRTHIVYRSNINTKLVAKYVLALTESGMLHLDETRSGASVYTTTERGSLFVTLYESLRSVFDPETRLILSSHVPHSPLR